MNHNLSKLQPYPFEKLAKLTSQATVSNLPPIVMSVGEPKHPAPQFVQDELKAHVAGLSQYPSTQGTPELREAIARWLEQRFKLSSVDGQKQVLPCNGTREALFAIAQCVVDSQDDALVVMPNPFYQIYEGAALLAGASCAFANLTDASGFLPDFNSITEAEWQKCQLLYLCSPGNPAGKIMPRQNVEALIALADKYDFVICADECYSEIYFNEGEAPLGLLQIAAGMGRDDFSRLLVFHSLSKRSSLPGLRSGFVAGDAKLIEKFLLYRTYHGSAMSVTVQKASIKAWQDEAHVRENRLLYQRKFEAVIKILSPVIDIAQPEGGFYLWLKVPGDDQDFARELFRLYNVVVLPGSFLSRTVHGINPGEGYVRIALVPPLDECVDAANRMKELIVQLAKGK
jgi:N-succinyldiaminopimelate aminotransferase